MITGQARDELMRILNFSVWKDLKIIELKIVPGKPRSKNSRDSIEAILTCAAQPSDVLRQQRLRKSVLRRYLWGLCIAVTPEMSKEDYIRICLELWQVKDDDYLWKFRSEDEIDAVLDRFQESMKESLCDLKSRIRLNRPAPNELKSMKRSMDNMLSTITSVGTASPMSSPSAKVIKLSLSDSSASDNDSDSSSSSSSVKIIEHYEGSSSLDHFTEFAPSQLPTARNIFEPSSSQLPTARNIFGPSSSQPPTARKIFGPSPQSSSSMNDSESVLSLLQNSTQMHAALLSQTNISEPLSSHANISESPSSRTSASNGSETTTETSLSRDRGQLIQTVLSNFFK